MSGANGQATELPGGLARTVALLDPARRPRSAPLVDGVLDLLSEPGSEPPQPTGVAQRLMLTGVVPAVYEHWWRPALGRLAKGALGPSMDEERRIARLLLALEPGDGVLEIACGPGNFLRNLATVVGPAGVAVGVDVSPSMLARAVADTPAATTRDGNVAYLRADATRLPFKDASFDAVCCFAALHLFADPWAALDQIARVLTPGGRVALFTSCRTRSAPLRLWDGFIGERTGIHMFDRDQITDALAARGFVDVRRKVSGLTQFVGGRRGD